MSDGVIASDPSHTAGDLMTMLRCSSALATDGSNVYMHDLRGPVSGLPADAWSSVAEVG